jgi:hypothetical protein
MAQRSAGTLRKHHIIYKTTCITTNRYYIGMHSTDDLNDGYVGSGTRLWRSIKKYGKDQHRCEILEHLPTRQAASDREKELINPVWRADPLCMNIGKGGEGNAPGYRTAEETLTLISENSKRMWAKRREDGWVAPPQKPEHVAKRVKANTGKKRTAEQKANLVEGQASYFAAADKNVLQERGRRSAATRQERGSALGGRPKGIAMTEEAKLHLGSINKGKIWPRATCTGCGKETTLGALNRYHTACSSHA